MVNLRKYYIYILPILSGVLFSIPFSYPSLFPLSWLALLPFLYLLERWKKKEDKGYLAVFIAGNLLGITIMVLSSSWLYYPLAEHSGLSFLVALFLLILVFVFYGAIYGLWALIYVFVKRSPGVSPVWLAISWIAMEFLRFRSIPAFPFAFAAYTQSSFLSLLQFAEYGGIYLVGLVVILFNGYLYKTIASRKIRFILPAILILIFILGVGWYLTNNYAIDSWLKVGVVQTNLDPVEKWRVNNIEKNMDYLVEESRQLPEAELIVWPESSLTFDIIRNEFYRNRFLQQLKSLNSYLQIGSLSIMDDDFARYNSSFLIGPGGVIKNRYNKVRLVPFGEYMPLSNLVEKLTGISMVSQLPGNELVIFQMGEISWKTVICSEILYPGLVGKGVDEAQFIVNQSNEAWYKRGNLQEQMWIAARFRAVENRRAVLKAGNVAYGGVIAPTGEEIMKKHSRELSTFSLELPLNIKGETLYQKWGDYPGYISALILLLSLLLKIIICLKRNKRKAVRKI